VLAAEFVAVTRGAGAGHAEELHNQCTTNPISVGQATKPRPNSPTCTQRCGVHSRRYLSGQLLPVGSPCPSCQVCSGPPVRPHGVPPAHVHEQHSA
jgi:hypothetical protein